jgi:hypothetical protein
LPHQKSNPKDPVPHLEKVTQVVTRCLIEKVTPITMRPWNGGHPNDGDRQDRVWYYYEKMRFQRYAS